MAWDATCLALRILVGGAFKACIHIHFALTQLLGRLYGWDGNTCKQSILKKTHSFVKMWKLTIKWPTQNFRQRVKKLLWTHFSSASLLFLYLCLCVWAVTVTMHAPRAVTWFLHQHDVMSIFRCCCYTVFVITLNDYVISTHYGTVEHLGCL